MATVLSSAITGPTGAAIGYRPLITRPTSQSANL